MLTLSTVLERIQDIRVPDALLGLLVGIVLNSFARSWKYAKDLNKYRVILLEFIAKIGIDRTNRYIQDSNTAISVIACTDFEEHKRLASHSALDALPMLNSDVFRNIPMPILKDVLYGPGMYGEIFTFYHCIDYTMQETPLLAFERHVEFLDAHLKEKELEGVAIDEEFRSCEVIATRRRNDRRRIEGRRKRAELNLVFFKELQSELSGWPFGWKLRYLRRALF